MIGEKAFDTQMEDSRTQIQILNYDSKNKVYKEHKRTVEAEVQT